MHRQGRRERRTKGGVPARRRAIRGTTDERAATHRVRAKFSICEECGSKWIKIIKISEAYLTDIPQTVYMKILMRSLVGICMGCNREIEGEFNANDIREIKPPDDTGEGAPSSTGPVTGVSGGDDDTDSKAPVYLDGVREVSVGNGLVQLVRDEVVPVENVAESATEAESPATLEDTEQDEGHRQQGTRTLPRGCNRGLP